MSCPDLFDYTLSEHAVWEMGRRGITEHEVALVIRSAEQREEVRLGRCVYQARSAAVASQAAYVLRVFVDVDRVPAVVVTVYRTSKVQKYWR